MGRTARNVTAANALVVADDLTGAIDTGHGFAARGRGVRVALHESGSDGGGTDATAANDADVLAVDTDTRDVSPETAAEAVATVVTHRPAPLVYKKVDSTLRGNPVAEIDAAVGATGARVAAVAPAFPAAGRTTVDGCQLVEGTPLAEAGYGVDKSHLPSLLSASQYPVSHVGLDVVEDGVAAVRQALLATGAEPTLVACDATTGAHLETIAAAAGSMDRDPLYVGSGGLAKHVSVPGAPVERTDSRSETSGRGSLAVVGSVNERTLDQLVAVPDELVVKLDPWTAVRDPETAGRDAATALRERLARRGRAVVTAATGLDDVAWAERVAATCGVDPATRVAAALASAATATVAETPPAGLALTGGDTARAVLTALDARELILTGDAVAEGLPRSRLSTGSATGTRVVTKAGGFGDQRAILNCLDAVRA